MFMKKLIGILLILCGFVILIGSVASSGIGSGWYAGKHPARDVTIENVRQIRIDATSSVTVIPEKRLDVKTVLQGKGMNDVDMSIQKKGNELTILVKPKWYLWMRQDQIVRLNVYVPKSYDQNMTIHSLGGNLDFAGQEGSQLMKLNELKVDMVEGNINLKNLRVNRLDTNSMSGNTKLDLVTAESANFHSSSGNVTLNHFSGSFCANLSLGNLKAQIDQVSGPIQADQVSGDMEVNLPRDADFALRAQVDSGNVKCDFIPCQRRRKNWAVTATAMVKSGKNKIQLHNISGNVHIY
jgi:lia operon protein LiaG